MVFGKTVMAVELNHVVLVKCHAIDDDEAMLYLNLPGQVRNMRAFITDLSSAIIEQVEANCRRWFPKAKLMHTG